MDKDRIKIYKDEKLLNLTQRMAMFDQEEVEFFFSDITKTSSGKTREDLARDMIGVYEETNEHLRNMYPDNTVATSWIGTNQFSANLRKGRISNRDPHTSN